MTPKPYFILSEVATQDKINSLLGRAVPFTSAKPGDVENPLKRPAEGRIYPILPPEGPDLRELDKHLYPQGVKAKEAKILLESARGTDAEVAITKALALFHSSSKSNKRAASIPGFRRLTIDQAPHRIEQLLKHDQYSKPIFDYFTKYPNGKLGIIVSIICAMDMSLNIQQAQSRDSGVQVEVPKEAVAAPGGPPVASDTGARISTSSTKVSEAEGTYDGEIVVACGYLQMTRKPQSLLKAFLQSGPKVFFQSRKTSIDDITITSKDEFVHPRTMDVSLPPSRLPGDHEAYLGGNVDFDEQHEAPTHEETSNNSDDDMILYV
ncbi:uncharacterized protein F4807DRAFT_434472 [Annulohypoxylon truncatum]|uniref:uncharacterized protein n=1 Tax=Annulohypoxylon truncatum TaxID=327061 RepID=UPI00200829F3|nr:uncharacterized protein F4807DRAFT_434472 [Annulohypoxylon truncatum]KAI1207406.1 hypothetical protein F4807DRAFT_434472 [Annulohypoxylon truncatum]